jgi:DNA-binding MurR/RpiR family transcriptional regulator
VLRDHRDRLFVDSELGKRLTSARLTPVQRRIARHILESPRDAAFRTSVDLAETIGVSQPSVTRFATAVGFSGYPDFVRTLRETLFDDTARADTPPETDEWSAVIDRSIEDLRGLSDWLRGSDAVRIASREMMASSPLLVYGCRLSLGVSEVFSYLAAKIHPLVVHLDSRGGTVADRIAQAVEAGASCMFAVVLPRYPREAEKAISIAKRAGLKVILLTDSPLSPLARQCDQALYAPVNYTLVFDAFVAPMQLISILLDGMVDADPEPAERRLDAFEELAAREGLFLSES